MIVLSVNNAIISNKCLKDSMFQKNKQARGALDGAIKINIRKGSTGNS